MGPLAVMSARAAWCSSSKRASPIAASSRADGSMRCALLLLVVQCYTVTAFRVNAVRPVCVLQQPSRGALHAVGAAEDAEEPPSGAASLEEKMASWEATEEEQRKATLGGMIPGKLGKPGRDTRTDQPTKMDGFDIGMNISGIILFPLAIILATFPFWIGGVDFNSVGPPPTS